MKYKVSELEGALLRRAVATADHAGMVIRAAFPMPKD